MNRSVRNGIVPPAWEKMNRMSGKRAAAPLNSRLAMVRVVSVPYSMTAGGMSGTRFRQQLAAVGCVYTTAWRRLTSSITGANAGSPSHLSP